MLFKKLVILAGIIALPFSALAEINDNSNPTQPFINITGPNQVDGVNVNPNTAAPGNFTTLSASGPNTFGGTTTYTGAQTFSSATTFNNAATFNSAITVNNTAAFNNVPTFNSAMTIQNTATFNSSPVLASGISSYAAQYSTFGNSLLTNPLMQDVFESFTTSSVNSGVNVLNSAAGRKIFPGAGLTVFVSGTAAGATSLNLECSPSARIIATWPIAYLVNNVPVGIFTSSTTGNPNVVLGSALTGGCNAADSILLSANGSLTTTTQVFVNLPYTVQ